MIFKCNNCGGHMIYSPERRAMYCEHCDSVNTESVSESTSINMCPNCGAPVESGNYDSTAICEHCGVSIVFDERVSGQYTPHIIIPFKLGKLSIKERLKEHFKKNIFLPSTFLSNAYLEKMEGIYVPFWMYDYDANYDFEATGTKVRRWVSGNTEYTETSIYKIQRNMDIDFDLIPADASIKMDDGTMDLVEPYDFAAIEEFKVKYMAGFDGEMYNYTAEEMEYRAKDKAAMYADRLVRETISGYTNVRPEKKALNLVPQRVNYALLPVWRYIYQYEGKSYEFYINGQTGKIVGEPPMSKIKMIGYSFSFFTIMSLIAGFGWALLEVL